MRTPGQRFNRIIVSLDGDEELFAQIAQPVADRYAVTAAQLQLLLEDRNFAGIRRLAHKLKATWALYADTDLAIPEALENDIDRQDTEMTIEHCEQMIRALRRTTDELQTWINNYDQADG